jgi:hypothetical protein
MIDPAKVLAGLPLGLRNPLIESYREIVANYVEHRWEPSALNGGKFCEIVYSIVHGALLGSFQPNPSKPQNMAQACWSLEDIPPDPNRVGDRSLRILIPRTLLPLYEIRNNRGVGHVGGDVNPNFLDATAVYGMASWVLAELVRIFHQISTQDAQETVDALIERRHPLIWEVDDVRRVLDAEMSAKDQVLVLLHQSRAWVPEKELVRWTEYAAGMFPRRIVQPLHDRRFVEYDRVQRRVRISPLGVKDVEERILKSRT